MRAETNRTFKNGSIFLFPEKPTIQKALVSKQFKRSDPELPE